MEQKRLQLEHLIARPERRRYATPLLLLHGAWHGAWCWRAALDDFAARGFEAHAISLRGHGHSSRPRSFNLSSLRDYVRDLAVAIDSIHPRPIVVGHSMGGFVLQLYLMEYRLPRAVLLCSAPHTGALPFLARWLARHPLASLSGYATLSTRRLLGTPALARDALFRETIAPDQLRSYHDQIGPESVRAAIEMSLTLRPDPSRSSTPLLVIAAGRDGVFTLDEQRALARAYRSELLLVPEAAHDIMLDPDWEIAADAIERFALRGGLDPSRA